MPTLQFKGKSFVQNHHLAVKFHQLVGVKGKSLTDKVSLHDNLIVQGDNLKALKALLPTYAGKVKCIYIDPPYNTGTIGWKYTDDVNSPMMQDWLKSWVDKEDLTRHDKWACMMMPRLKLLKELLATDGLIFISIDDHEHHRLRLLMDEVFGKDRFLASFAWVRKKKGSFLSKQIRKMTEYVMCYKNSDEMFTLFGEKAYADKWQPIVKRTNKEKDLVFQAGSVITKLEDGRYKKGARGSEETGLTFLKDFSVEDGLVVSELRVNGHFTWEQEFLDEEVRLGTQVSLSKEVGFNVLRHDQAEKVKAPATFINSDQQVGTNEDATAEIADIFCKPVGEAFDYPKPVSLVEYLLRMIVSDDKNAVVLDSFAGSGTTAHAVLNLNKDGGTRRFILVQIPQEKQEEDEENITDEITAERVRRVIKGVPKSKNYQEGTGGSFSYFKLGAPIEMEHILHGDRLPSYEELARYVFYTATGEEFNEADISTDKKKPFIGKSKQYPGGVYLFYKPDMEHLMNTSLSLDMARALGKHNNKRRLVFAPMKYLDQDYLDEMRIDYSQLPFEIYKFKG